MISRSEPIYKGPSETPLVKLNNFLPYEAFMLEVVALTREVLKEDKRVSFEGSTRGYLSFFNVSREEVKLLARLGYRGQQELDSAIIITGVGNLSPAVKIKEDGEKGKIVAEAIGIALNLAKRNFYQDLKDQLVDGLNQFLQLRIPEVNDISKKLTKEDILRLLEKAVHYQTRKLSPWLNQDLKKVSAEIKEQLKEHLQDLAEQEWLDHLTDEMWREFLEKLAAEDMAVKIDDERFSIKEEVIKLFADGIGELKDRYEESSKGDIPKKRDIDPYEKLGELDVQIGISGGNESIMSLKQTIDLAMDLPGMSEKDLFDPINNFLGRGDSPSRKITDFLNEMLGEDAPLITKARAFGNFIHQLIKEGLLEYNNFTKTFELLQGIEVEQLDIKKLDKNIKGLAIEDVPSSMHVKKSLRRSPSKEFSGLKAFQIGDSSRSVHLSKTSSRLTRQEILGLPLRHKDITVKRYRSHVSADYVILLDTSNSMEGTKIYLARQAVAKFIKGLNKYSEDRVALIEFDVKPSLLWGLENVKRDCSRMIKLIASLDAGGGTDIKPALEKAKEILRRSRNELRHIVAISDGRTIDVNCHDILRSLSKMNVTLSTVGIGGDADEEFLYLLARKGGGVYFKIDSIQKLDKVLKFDHYMTR